MKQHINIYVGLGKKINIINKINEFTQIDIGDNKGFFVANLIYDNNTETIKFISR